MTHAVDKGEPLVAAYGIGTPGVLLQTASAHWDVSWHILGIVETFLLDSSASGGGL